jgi:ABC-type multidrug transport system ATPase subunit
MEEAEALATRIGIMAKGGQFRCFDSSHQIRNRYSKSFQIHINVPLPTADTKRDLAKKLGVAGKNQMTIQEY